MIVDQGVRSQRFRSQQGLQWNGFTVSRAWLNKGFGKEAEQMPSSTSVVVMTNDKLYKYHLRATARAKVYELDVMYPMICKGMKSRPLKPNVRNLMNDSCFQIVLRRNRINVFFLFTLLNRPRNREAVKRMDIKTFVVTVKEAIASMHTILRIAHLDIRLENICWRKTGSLMSFYVGNDWSNIFSFRKRRRRGSIDRF